MLRHGTSRCKTRKLIDHGANLQQPAKQRAELVERDHVRTVTGRAVGSGVCLAEESIGSERDGRTGKWFHHCPVATRGIAEPTRLLHAVRRVENHWYAEALHLRNGTHVVHQPAVAEERAS